MERSCENNMANTAGISPERRVTFNINSIGSILGKLVSIFPSSL
jgi:hypothetical protein